MKCEPIICNGNELESVLAGIRDRGGVPESIDTMVNSNSGYRVNYFGDVAESDRRYKNDIGEVIHKSDVRAVAAPRMGVKSKVAGSNPAIPDSFPHQCETPANPAAPEAVKGAVAPRNQVIGVQIPAASSSTQRSCVTSHPEGNGGADAVGVDSIETLMAALQARLTATGRIRRNKPREARLPYAQD